MTSREIKQARWKNAIYGYGAAILLAGVPIFISSSTPQLFTNRPFLAFYPAVVATAALFGMGPGILCAIISGLCVDIFVTPPIGSLKLSDGNEMAGVIIFVLSGIAISLLAGMRQNASTARQLQAVEAQAIAEQLKLRIAAIEAAAEMIVITDSKGDIQYVNPAFTKITGYSSDEVLGKNPRLLKSGAHNEALYRELWSTIEAGEVWRGEIINRRKDGSLYSEEMSITPVADHCGKITHFIAIKRDITQRKAAQQELLENRYRLAAIVNSAMDAIITVDEHHRIVLFNPAAERIFGYLAKEVMNGPLNRLLPERYHKAHEHHINIFGQTGRSSRDMGYLRPLAALRSDGQEFPIEASISQVEVEGHHLFSVIVRDITERKRVEEELRSARMSAERAKGIAETANSAKDRFLAVLSHELRTPLTAVIPSLEAIQGMVPSEGSEYLEIARRNVELEARLIDDLLDVTRIARGKIELDRKPALLNTIVQRAVDVCLADINGRHLHFNLKIDGAPCIVNADQSRLQQVFWNLLKNAVKFTPEGGCIGMHISPSGDGKAVIEVADSGTGIEPEALKRIFNAFEQETRATTRQFGGLGLGLAITRSLVTLHGGTIDAHSEGKGKGAMFRVELPIVESITAQIPAVTMPAAETPKRSLRILLVEDHGDTARILSVLLRSDGHSVKHAGDVATALKLARNHTFDVLLSDVGLPDGTGHDLMRQLQECGRSIPGIALSGYGMASDIQQSRLAGFVEHITKPTNFHVLKDALRRTMASSRPESGDAEIL